MQSKKVQFEIVPKGPEECRSKIQVSPTGIQIIDLNNSGENQYILPPNGGERCFEYEVHRNYAKQSNSYRKRRRQE